MIRVVLVTITFVAVFYCGVSNAVAASSSGGPTTSASTNDKVVTFGTQTASATKPDSRGYYNFGATPGGEVLDHVALRNYSTQSITLAIKGTDAENDANGDFAFRPINQRSVDLGSWIEVLRSDLNVTIPARSYVVIPFLVVVPADATPGDHIGGITATLESSIVAKGGASSKVRLLQTVGSEVYVRVSGPLHPGLVVKGLKGNYTGALDPIATGRVRLTYRVVNEGNVALGGRQTVYVSGLFGSKRFAVHIKNLPVVLPGYSVPVTTTLSDVYPEVYERAHVSVRPLPLAGAVAPPLKTISATLPFWAVPWAAVAIVVAVVLVVALLIRRRRRRRKGGGALTGGLAGPGDGPGGKIEVPDLPEIGLAGVDTPKGTEETSHRRGTVTERSVSVAPGSATESRKKEAGR